MAGFHLNFSMVALYETRLSLVTFEFCDGGVVQRIFVFDSDDVWEEVEFVTGGKQFCFCTKAFSYSCII